MFLLLGVRVSGGVEAVREGGRVAERIMCTMRYVRDTPSLFPLSSSSSLFLMATAFFLLLSLFVYLSLLQHTTNKQTNNNTHNNTHAYRVIKKAGSVTTSGPTRMSICSLSLAIKENKKGKKKK